MAVGKLTTAKLIAEKTEFKLVHNHLLVDLVASAFRRDDPPRDSILEKLCFDFYADVAEHGVSITTTHTYAHNYTSTTGLTDPEYMQRLESIFTKNGYKVLFVHLKATKEEILKRVVSPDRKEFKKLTCTSVMEEILVNYDYSTPAPIENGIVIENTDREPESVVDEILKHVIFIIPQKIQPHRTCFNGFAILTKSETIT